jgi:hypothetical protein
MVKRWIGVGLVALCLGEVPAVTAQYLPCPAPPPPPEPMPTAVMGPLPPNLAPPGPADLSLTDKANAWTPPREPGSNAWESSALKALDCPEPTVEGLHHPALNFGVGVYIFQPPHFTNNVAFTETTSAGTVQFDFGYQMMVAPRLWLGYTIDNGLGVRMDWWGLRQGANSLRALPFGNKGSLQFQNTDTSAGIVPTGANGPTTIRTPSPFPGFGIVSPDTSVDLTTVIPGSGFVPGVVGGDNILPVGTAASALANGISPEVLTFANQLKMDVWDFEATGEFNFGQSLGVGFGVGMRYAYISQSYYALRMNKGATSIPVIDADGGAGDDADVLVIDEDSAVMASGGMFYGVGPTVSCSVQARLPWLLNNLTVFGNARGSLLFGQQKLQVFQQTKFNGHLLGETNTDTDNTLGTDTLDQVIPFHYTAFNQNIVRGKDVIVPNADLEAGLGWGTPIGRGDFFAQASFVTQFWHHVGNATSLVGDLRLVGLSVVIGFDY